MKKVFAALAVLLLVFGVAAIGSLSACGSNKEEDSNKRIEADDDGDDDVTLDRIEGVPDEVNEFLDPEDVQAIEGAGMVIHRGNNPPNVEGIYLADSLIVTYDDYGGEGMMISPYQVRYYNQTDQGRVSLDYETIPPSDEGSGLGAFISGDNGCFTVFIDIEGAVSGCEYAMPSLHSGCVGDDGVEGFVWGLIMRHKYGGAACDALLPEGAVRLATEIDGVAEKLL